MRHTRERLHPGDLVATGTHHEGLGPVNPGDTLEIEIERLGRARFHVRGDGERKDLRWQAGLNLPLEPGLSITRV